VKLGDVVTIGLAVGVYALLALTFVLAWMDSAQRPGADAKACRALDHATSASPDFSYRGKFSPRVEQ
jgi:hypothetical protein